MKLVTLICLTFFSASLFGQSTPGDVSLSITTKPNGEAFSPKHVLAIWIEDSSGDFVKTIKLNADKRKQYLYTWNSSSSGNTTDATTGSTLSSHRTHNVNWDCTNTSGTVVKDGSYSFRIEYTSEHAQGPITSIDFTKSADAFSVQPADESYFTDMDLVFTPEQSSGLIPTKAHYQLSTYPVPANEFLNIELILAEDQVSTIKVYQSDMKLVKVLNDNYLHAGRHLFSWDLTWENGNKVAAGVYLLTVKGKYSYSSRQIIVE